MPDAQADELLRKSVLPAGAEHGGARQTVNAALDGTEVDEPIPFAPEPPGTEPLPREPVPEDRLPSTTDRNQDADRDEDDSPDLPETKELRASKAPRLLVPAGVGLLMLFVFVLGVAVRVLSANRPAADTPATHHSSGSVRLADVEFGRQQKAEQRRLREEERRAAADAAAEKERRLQLAQEEERRRQEDERRHREFEAARARRERTHQTLVPHNPKAALPAPPPDWADACDFGVRQGDAVIHFMTIASTDERTEVHVTVLNDGAHPLAFRPWSAEDGENKPSLLHDDGRMLVKTQMHDALILAPSRSVTDRIVFEGKLPDTDLKLELPGACVSGDGKLRILIPRRLAEVEAAARLGEKGLPTLRASLQDKRDGLRLRAVAAIAGIGEGTISDLARLLSDTSPMVRMGAIAGLVRIGPRSSRAAPEIFAAMKDSDADVRLSVIRAIPKLGVLEIGMGPLLGALCDPNPGVALEAVEVLRTSQKLRKEHVPGLVKGFLKGPAEARKPTLQLLIPFAPHSSDAIAAVIEALDDRQLQSFALDALRKAGPGAVKAVPRLCKLLDEGDDATKRRALMTLADMGPRATAAVPKLIDMLKADQYHDAVADAMVKIGRGAVGPILEAIDKDRDFKTRMELIAVLGEIGPDAKDAIKPLNALLEENKLPGIRRAIQTALARINRNKK